MNDYHIDVDYSREQDQRAEERDRHDEHEATTYERAEPLLKKMMGESFGKYFEEETTAKEIAEDEQQADYERENKMGMI